jgi:hypothetical protein
MTRITKPIEMPELTIEAIVQIQDFLQLALDVFVDHYSEQLEAFYQPMWDDSPELDLGDFST